MQILYRSTCQCRRYEMRVWSLDQEDSLEKGMATHFSIHAQRIPWTEEPGGLQSLGLQRVRHDKRLSTYARTTHQEAHDKPRQHIKKQRYHFSEKGPYSQSYGFSSSHVWMWELDHEEGWVPKNWCFWIVVLEKTLKSPLHWKEIKPVNPKEINPEYSLEGLMLQLKLQYFGHLMGSAHLLEKILMLGKIEGRRRSDRGWDGWMASPTQSSRVWSNSWK